MKSAITRCATPNVHRRSRNNAALTEQHSSVLIQHSHLQKALQDEAGALASLQEARMICERVLTGAPWVFSCYALREEIMALLAPLRPLDLAADAVFLRRYSRDLLGSTEPAQGEMEYLRRLLEILRETGSRIASVEGGAAAVTWWTEQVTYLRSFLPGAVRSGTAPPVGSAHWDWIVAEMEKT